MFLHNFDSLRYIAVSQSVALNDSVIIRWIVQQEQKYKILVRNSLDEVVKSTFLLYEMYVCEML